MNRFFGTLVLCLTMWVTGISQIELGIKAGLSSYDLAHDGFLVKNSSGILEWNTENAGYGHHLGVYTRWTLWGVYLESSLLFNSNSMNHHISYYGEGGLVNVIKNEKYNHLNLPVVAGIKLGALRFHGGVVGHFLIDRVGEVFEFDQYSQQLQRATYGWQAGTGIDILRLRLDLSYEGNFQRFGDEIVIQNHSYTFAKTPGRLILSCGFRF